LAGLFPVSGPCDGVSYTVDTVDPSDLKPGGRHEYGDCAAGEAPVSSFMLIGEACEYGVGIWDWGGSGGGGGSEAETRREWTPAGDGAEAAL
jgi:hypothetical protein